MATAGSGAPPFVGTHEDVHVTGRRVLAIIVDGLLVGIPSSLVTCGVIVVQASVRLRKTHDLMAISLKMGSVEVKKGETIGSESGAWTNRINPLILQGNP